LSFPNPNHFAAALIDWFKYNRRELPWRDQPTPYAVWISEVMLQQTTVATVVPRFVRWMTRFPSVEALADATEEEVLREWEGLGYYARARNLRKAAIRIIRDFGGEIPHRTEDLRKLPGVGRYTAAAIASIAFQQPVPAIDANVRRILRRICGVNPLPVPDLEEFLLQAIEISRPEVGGEALMELGQVICLPANPKCDVCPLFAICRSAEEGVSRNQPVAKAIRRRTEVAVVSVGDGFLALLPPSPDGLFAGLYRLPTITLESGADPLEEARKAFKDLPAAGFIGLPKVVHHFTQNAVTLFPVIISGDGRSRCEGMVEAPLDRASDYPMPSAHRRILDLAGDVIAEISGGRGVAKA